MYIFQFPYQIFRINFHDLLNIKGLHFQIKKEIGENIQ